MYSSLQMNSSKTICLIAVIALIMLFVFPIQSISINDDTEKIATRHKRWTFNTWRLHGRRQLSNDFYFPKTSTTHNNHHYEIPNHEEQVTRKIDERLLQIFRELHRQ